MKNQKLILIVSGQLRAKANVADPGFMCWDKVAITAVVVAALIFVAFFVASCCLYKKHRGNFLI